MRNKIHWDAMRKLAIAHQLEEPASSQDALLRFLRFWWCQKYDRPFKDPLLLSYTSDELCYEYLRYYYSLKENDPKKKIEEQKQQESDEAWIKKMLEGSQKNETNPTSKAEPASDLSQQKDTQIPDLPDISTQFDPAD